MKDMGKVQSVVKLTGKVGGSVYYMLNGKQVVRKMAAKRRGPKTAGEQKRALDNIEFGKASAAGKFLRQTLEDETSKLDAPLLYQRLNRLLLRIKDFDPAARGERTVQGGFTTCEGKEMFSKFCFQAETSGYPLLVSAQREGARFQVQYINPTAIKCTLIELEINFANGAFRKYHHQIAGESAQEQATLKRKFRTRKRFTSLLLISGEGFLQGVICDEKDADKATGKDLYGSRENI